MIELQDLNFSYDNSKTVLNHISLSFGAQKQRVIGIMGHNGSGKSTLFLNLVGILKPTSGLILVDNHPIKYNKKGLRQLRRKIGIVFQDSDQQIFYSIVKDDVAFALRNLKLPEEQIEKRVEKALKQLDIWPLRDKPIQYLSGGQKKRVAIAGILVLNSEWLLLDEPTAGLDPDGRQRMMILIKQLVANGQKVILSSHDMDFMYETCDYFYLLGKGHIIKEGTKDVVFDDEEVLKANKLNQPWLIKLHQKLGLPLCNNSQELFALRGHIHVDNL